VVVAAAQACSDGTKLARLLRESGATLMQATPVTWRLLLGSGWKGQAGLKVLCGGEALTRELAQALLATGAELWNLYGPTETNVCTYYRVGTLPEDDATIPIGRACENTEVFAVTRDGRRADVGEEGELFVRGSAVMKGYWGAPERSAEVLVPNPLEPGLPDLVYRTGDLVRLRPDGDYDFIGRRDHQIKSRGYRVELGEVEAALHADPRLDAAVAVAVPHEDWGNAIVAYVVPKDEAVTEIQVKREVARRLPRYMVPARVEVRRDLPKTSTGKIDRRSVADEATSKAWSWT
jgi:acyl-CoA synthetase (AMP-forming)/AMP-acid ligase II